jgi:hypothetical protein
MNTQQTYSLLRTLLGTVGGVVMGWFASKGWHLSADDTKNVMALLQSPEVIGLAMSVLTGALGLVAHTQANAVAVVAQIAADPASPIVGIITAPTAEGRTLAASLPAEVASANTPAANAISKDAVPPMTPKAT